MFYRDICADLFYCLTGYDVISYFRSIFIEVRKKAENAQNFSGTAFCLPPPIGGFLVCYDKQIDFADCHLKRYRNSSDLPLGFMLMEPIQ